MHCNHNFVLTVSIRHRVKKLVVVIMQHSITQSPNKLRVSFNLQVHQNKRIIKTAEYGIGVLWLRRKEAFI